MADFLQISDSTAVRVSDISGVSVDGSSSTFRISGESLLIYTPNESFAVSELLLLLETVKEAPGVSIAWDKAWEILDEKMDALSDDEVTAIYDAMGLEPEDDTFKDESE